MPAAIVLSHAPVAPAATVLAAEGTLQPTRSTQRAFSGKFCVQNTCRSINNARTPLDVSTGSRQMQAAVDATPGEIILMGYSLGAASIYDRMRVWSKSPALAPDSQRVMLVVTFGNPENKFGGTNRKSSYAGLPAVQRYPHLDVTLQYDSIADAPTRRGWYSSMNNSFARHLEYFQPVDINDPNNLIYQDEGTTHMLIKADVLPMLKWRAWFTSPARMAELDAKYRPLIERDYDRPAYIPQGEGADWGNGNAPPSLTGDGGEAQRPPVESSSATTTFASDELRVTSRSSNREHSERKLAQIDNSDKEDLQEPPADDDTDSVGNDESERDAGPASGTTSDTDRDTDTDTDSGSDESADAA